MYTHWVIGSKSFHNYAFKVVQRVYFFDNFEIVANCSDKNTLMTIIIKLTYNNIFIKVKKIR